MKNGRAAVVLEMLFRIEEKGYFEEHSIRDEMGVSRSTFFRSLSDFRCFLMEHRPHLELVFNDGKDRYELIEIHI